MFPTHPRRESIHGGPGAAGRQRTGPPSGQGAGGQYKSQCVSEEKEPSTDAHTWPRASLTGGQSELAGVNSEAPDQNHR